MKLALLITIALLSLSACEEPKEAAKETHTKPAADAGGDLSSKSDSGVTDAGKAAHD